jgi:hypothetical protein
MNRKLLLFCAATLPLFLGAVVVQAIQYQDLKRDVAAMEKEQDVWVEKNKKVLAGVNVLRSPERIETLAEQDPGLTVVGADKTVKVKFPEAAPPAEPQAKEQSDDEVEENR